MSDALLSVKRLQVRFGGFVALDDVSFDLQPGQTLGLVGESGSGKSTLARALLRLIPATSGDVLWAGENMRAWSQRQLRRRRREMQIVFQDPMASLNPRMSAADAIAEPLDIFEPALSSTGRRRRVDEMLERVGLSSALADRHPHEFSGGQCQRIGIARAMILKPRLLVCDEPVSSLDVSIQGQIVNLLADLQQEWGTAMLFISHNLAVVRHLSHRVLVIYRGRAVEVADCDGLFAGPVHPYTRALLAAVPDHTQDVADAVPADTTASDVLRSADVPSADVAARSTRGCAYLTRCRFAHGRCGTSVPALQEMAPGHWVACHRWREVVYS